MDIFSFKYIQANQEEYPVQYNAGVRSWRWAFSIKKYYFGFFQQVKTTDSDWHECSGTKCYYMAWNDRCSRWGRFHDYYDGPLDSFCIGRLQFHWTGDWCNKCMPE